MPTISISDEKGKTLLSSDLPSQGLGRYIKAATSIRSLVATARDFSKPLADESGGRQLDLSLEKDVPIGSSSELTLGAGAAVGIGLHPSGSTIFAGSDLQAPETVPNGTACTSLTLEAQLKVGFSGQEGHLGFGFSAGTALRYAYFHPFNIVGESPEVGEAVKTMLASAVYPADTDDLRRLAVGAHVSLAGHGELSFSGSASLSTSSNILATPGLPIVGALAVTQGASVSVSAAWSASGDFELRLSKPAASQMRLAFHRRRGRSLEISAKAQAGVTATVRGKDWLAALMTAISPNPEADVKSLVNAGLGDEPIEAIQQAVAAGVDRTLSLSAQLQISAVSENEALFAYEVDLDRLDQAATDAVADALHGRLAAIERISESGGPIRMVSSAAHQVRSRQTTWRINLLGIVNVASFADLVREGSVTFDPVSGSLVAADRASSRRIRVESRPLESKTTELRRVLFESMMVTAAYQASRALGSTVSLTAEQIYVEQRSRTRRSDIDDHYQALIALGLCDEQERDARLGAETEFGTSTFVIQNAFDAAACDAMFIGADGKPHDVPHYERIARLALLALLPRTDPSRSFRRLALESDAMWIRARDLGLELEHALPDSVRHDPRKLALVTGDVLTIKWWAKAMSRAAAELVEMRAFLGQRDAVTLHKDAAFTKARNELSEALGKVVATTEARFDDPWDVIAMDAAASRLGTLEGVIIATRFAARYTDAGAPVLPATPASRGARAAVPVRAATAAQAERDWTNEEREVFASHVVNLRKGVLSQDGSFSSTRDQVARIFTDLIPAYARALPAGQRPRVLFFAHGGLIGEREGLLPVLARRRFWELNNVYPVYFVWETGLKETLRDLIGIGTRAARGAIGDLAIEQAARAGGKPVWSQMKKSAEKAAAAGGGSTLVAELAAGLWKTFKGEIEFHALGHSAGAIFHAFFLPQLVAQRPAGVPAVSVRTLHYLAPAITVDLFKSQLKKLIGSGQPITNLTTYTMADEFEQHDDSMKPYGKSLLYLVSNAFEADVPTALVGLQKSLQSDVQMIRFFGLAGREKVADIAFSRTLDNVPKNARTQSITHGGFDNDVATMTSVIRRVLDAGENDAVVDYFEEAQPDFNRPGVGMAGAGGAQPRLRRAGGEAVRGPAIRRRVARKPWTVMVWMAGDNNLESFGDKDLAEMKRIGSSDAVNVTVQFDRMGDAATRRYYVRKDTAMDADVVGELGETNTGDPAVAIDFFRWAIEEYPADRLLGVIWNHGSGIDETDIYARAAREGVPVVRGVPAGEGAIQRQLVRVALSSGHRRALFGTTLAQATHDRAIAYDDTSRDFLDNIELKRVLAEVKRSTGRTFDILGFDACLMNMIEVAYQLQGTTSFVVGSEELEPGDGWPYDKILGALAANPATPPGEVSATIVREFVDSYTAGSVTQSALDLSHLGTLAKAVDALAKALVKATKVSAEYAAITKALNATQRFDTPDYADLGHFCVELGRRSKAAAVKTGAKNVLAALNVKGVVAAERHKGAGVSQASGVAIYAPRGPANKAYKRLDFAKDTSWLAFLEAYHSA